MSIKPLHEAARDGTRAPPDLPVVLAIILVAARILQFAPTFAVSACRHEHQVAPVVQMKQRVSRLRADAVDVTGVQGKNAIAFKINVK